MVLLPIYITSQNENLKQSSGFGLIHAKKISSSLFVQDIIVVNFKANQFPLCGNRPNINSVHPKSLLLLLLEITMHRCTGATKPVQGFISTPP